MARRRTWWSNAALRQSIALTDGGGPAWASGAHLWKDFVVNRGNMSSPADTHAATIYAPNAAGVYLPFAANELVRTDLGLQVVPTRTNSIRNNSGQDAVAGTPGTLPTNQDQFFGGTIAFSIVGTGTEFGLDYVDYRINGTSNATTGGYINFETSTGITAATAQVWTNSFFARIVGGSAANLQIVRSLIRENTSAGASVTTQYGATNYQSLLSAGILRVTQTATLNGGGTTARAQPAIEFTYNNGAVIDLTIRIYMPQLELGAFASPPIRTTTAAATVTGNLPVVSGLSTQLAVGVAGFVQYDEKAANASLNRIIEISDGTTSNLLVSLRSASTTSLVEILVGGVSQGAVAATKPAEPAGITTVAFAFTSNFYSERFVGQAQGAVDAVSTYPTGLDRIGFLNRVAAATQNSYGFIRKVALKFGPQDQASFDAMYAKAVLAAAA